MSPLLEFDNGFAASRKRTLCYAQHRVVGLPRGKFQSCRNIFRLKKWPRLKNLLTGSPGSKLLQYVFDANAQAADAWPSSTLIRIQREALDIGGHGTTPTAVMNTDSQHTR
jgi:hypothetical protein